jgi:hypothetical protein
LSAETTLKKLGRLAPWFLLLAGAIWLLSPVETGQEQQVVRFAPSMTPVSAPRNVLVLRQFPEPYAAVKKGEPLFQVFDDQGTVDEALVVSRLEKLVADILKATNGKVTATVNQMRTKIQYSRALLSRSKRAGVVWSPVAGEFLPSGGVFDKVHRRGTVLGQILSGKKLMGALEYQPEVLPGLKAGQALQLRDIHVSGFPTQTLALPQGQISTSRISEPDADASRYVVGGSIKDTQGQPTAAIDPPAETDRPARVTRVEYLCLFKSRPMTAAELREAKEVLAGRPIAGPDGTIFLFQVGAGVAHLYRWEDQPRGEVLRCRALFELEAPELVAVANEAARQGRGLEGTLTVLTGTVPRWKRLAR